MKAKLLTILIATFLLFPAKTYSSHLLGGEITWECVPTGSDAGKLIFNIKLYRACYQGAANLPTVASISNPLYASHGGPASISCPLFAVNDLARPCFNPAYQTNCGVPIANGGGNAVEEHIYISAPVQINGIPSSSGSEFYFSTCCRPAATVLKNVSGSNYYLRSVMYPYIDPVSGNPRSLGSSTTGPTCYDSSPKFAARPQIAVCGRQNIAYSHMAFDVNGDALTYEWHAPMQAATNPITWRTGYNDTLQLPNKNHDTANVDPSLDTLTGIVTFNTNSPLMGYHSISLKAKSFKNGQKVAEVYRDIVVTLLDCDTINSTPTIFNAGPPTIGIKDTLSTSYSTSFSGTYPVGSQIALDLKATDGGLLPTNPLSVQSVDLELFGIAMSSTANDSTNCLVKPCAFIDSNNVAWQDSILKAPTNIDARFYWNTSCQNLEAFNAIDGGKSSNTFVFMVRSKDDWCPVPSESFTQIEITLVDTSATTWPVDSMDASIGGANIVWPMYSAGGFVSYEIYRSFDPTQPWTLINSISNQSTTSFYDPTAPTDSIPVYYLIEINNGPGCFIGYEIKSIHLDASVSGQFHTLQWNRPYTNTFTYTNGKYYIYRRDTLTTWDLIDSVAFGVETYVDPVYIYNEEVEYRIESTDQYGLYSISNVDSVSVDSIFPIPGIKENKVEMVKIYPNPAKDIINIDFEENHNYQSGSILDYSGKEISSFRLMGNKIEKIDVSKLESGLYFIRLSSDLTGSVYHRILIE